MDVRVILSTRMDTPLKDQRRVNALYMGEKD